MNHAPGRVAGIALVTWALSAAGPFVHAAGEPDYVTDIVFALDISNSMQTDNNFGKVRDRLIEFIRDEIDLETNVAVITFGEDARLVAEATIKGD
jgi:hypothetical protein